jgi:sugar O-acyltransferase (sialic acid O-acetyltransferase NeuD family)
MAKALIRRTSQSFRNSKEKTMRTVVIGGGTYGEAIVAYLLEHSSLSPEAVLDDDPVLHETYIGGVIVRGPVAELPELAQQDFQAVVVAIGSNEHRLRFNRWARELGLATPGFIHPGASVSNSCTLGPAVIILDGAVVQPYVSLGDSVVVSSNVSIAHHTVIEDAVFLAAGATIGAGISVGSMASAGVGACVMTGVQRVGERCIIGAGAAVIRDTAHDTKIVGVPGREI